MEFYLFYGGLKDFFEETEVLSRHVKTQPCFSGSVEAEEPMELTERLAPTGFPSFFFKGFTGFMYESLSVFRVL